MIQEFPLINKVSVKYNGELALVTKPNGNGK